MADAATVLSEVSPATEAWYNKKFMSQVVPQLVSYQIGQKQNEFVLPGGVGRIVYYVRYLPLAANTTAQTEDTTGGITADQFTTQEISATVKIYSGYGESSQMVEMAALKADDERFNGRVAVMANKMALTLDTIIRNAVAPAITQRRADKDTAFQKTAKTASAAGTTTTLIDTVNLTEANDYWLGALITFTGNTKNYGLVRRVTDFVNSTGTLTFAAVNIATGTNDTYDICIGTGTNDSDNLTSGNIMNAVFFLNRNKGMDFKGNTKVGILSPYTEADLWQDETFRQVATHQNEKRLMYNEIGTWCGVNWLRASEWARMDETGSVSSAGFHCVPIFARECFGNVKIEGGDKKLYIRSWEQLGEKVPMTGTIGYQFTYVPIVLNGAWGVNLLCGSNQG